MRNVAGNTRRRGDSRRGEVDLAVDVAHAADKVAVGGGNAALAGGEDGLMFYRAIVRHWSQILRPGGWLMFEVGEDQADAVMALMTEEKYTDVTALEDTAGLRRVVVGRI